MLGLEYSTWRSVLGLKPEDEDLIMVIRSKLNDIGAGFALENGESMKMWVDCIWMRVKIDLRDMSPKISY